MLIASIDHVVLTVADMDATIAFYTRVLGMQLEIFGEGRKALRFGEQKLNLQDGKSKVDIVAVAKKPTPGSVDLCLLAAVPLDMVIEHLKAEKVAIENGPVARTGARFPLRSVYIRDPDGNLIEISEPAPRPASGP
jgi:catechol 2,3-dioxygenase-like lactoylglutathione lyase family enzyme